MFEKRKMSRLIIQYTVGKRSLCLTVFTFIGWVDGLDKCFSFLLNVLKKIVLNHGLKRSLQLINISWQAVGGGFGCVCNLHVSE